MRRTLSFLLLSSLLALPFAPLVFSDEEPISAEQAELDQIIKELRIEAADIRGLEWKHDVPGAVIAPKDIPAALQKEVDALFTKEDQALATRLARRAGMLRPDEDILELQKSMMAGMAGGFYSPRAKKLFVVEGYTGDAARPVILHELVHALEDQYHDFDSASLPLMNDTDRTFAMTCVIEGSAEYARIEYQKRHKDITALFMQASRDPSQARRQMEVIGKVPAWMIVPMMKHYQTGPAFVGQALTRTRAAASDANAGNIYAQVIRSLWQDGPVSQEQVLHPERWFTENRDYPRDVVWAADFALALGKGWSVAADQRTGELDLALFLDYHLGTTQGRLNPITLMKAVPACDVAVTAAAGWDAGRTLFLQNGSAPMVMLQAWAFDSETDATEAVAAMLQAMRKMHGDAWAPQEWRAITPRLGAPLASRELHYIGAYGPGRILQRGTEVLIADGVPADRMDAVWRWVVRTRFPADARDTWGQ